MQKVASVGASEAEGDAAVKYVVSRRRFGGAYPVGMMFPWHGGEYCECVPCEKARHTMEEYFPVFYEAAR